MTVPATAPSTCYGLWPAPTRACVTSRSPDSSATRRPPAPDGPLRARRVVLVLAGAVAAGRRRRAGADWAEPAWVPGGRIRHDRARRADDPARAGRARRPAPDRGLRPRGGRGVGGIRRP